MADEPKCVQCGEVEDHLNHHSDYGFDWYHMKDHDFVPRSPDEETHKETE